MVVWIKPKKKCVLLLTCSGKNRVGWSVMLYIIYFFAFFSFPFAEDCEKQDLSTGVKWILGAEKVGGNKFDSKLVNK